MNVGRDNMFVYSFVGCFWFCFVLFFFLGLLENKSRRKKENMKKCKKENENYIQQGRIEITLKEHPGRADLPVPHYSPDGQSSREKALSIGH